MNATAAALAKVQWALRKLEPGQGAIARRNARKSALAALASLRRVVDVQFPNEKQRTLVKPVSRQGSTLQVYVRWKRRMRLRGCAEIPTGGLRGFLLQNHVRIYKPPGKAVRHTAQGWAPVWVLVAASWDQKTPWAFNVAKLRECRKSQKAREAMLAAARLGYGGAAARAFL